MSELFTTSGPTPPKAEAEKMLSFEQALEGLERVVKELEEGKVGLEESLVLYENGVALIRRCQEQLQRAEQRIVELVGQDGDGNIVTKPFEHSASVEPK
jgi:exodeoxyribonuclease VII small subunit